MTNPRRPDQSKWHLDWSRVSRVAGGAMSTRVAFLPRQPPVILPLLNKGRVSGLDGDTGGLARQVGEARTHD
jgi:hypothetical protein